MTKQIGGNNYAIFMIAAAVVRQPYSPAGQIHPWAVGCPEKKHYYLKNTIQQRKITIFANLNLIRH